MDDMRVAKAFLRKAAVYAEQHGISPVAAVREHDLPAGSQRALQTVKLQVCYAIADRSANQQAHQADEQHQHLSLKALQPILAASFGQTDTAIARQQDLGKVAKCIAAMLLPHIGSDPVAAEQRIEHAFASMFSAASLPRLTSLSKHERETELKQLANITLGICLFSECSMEGVTSEGQFDMEEYLQLLEDLGQRCTGLQHDLQNYNDAIVHRSSSEAPQEATMLQLNEELTYLHQAFILCHTMQDALTAALGNVSKQQSEQEQGLRDLQGLVGAALAVPKEVVQPAFASLGKRHLAILTEQRKLQLQPAFVTAVAQCIDVDKLCLRPELAAPGAANSIMPLAPIIDDSKGPKDPIDLAVAESASGVVRIAATDAPQSAVSHLSLGGFCPVSFVKRAGLLSRADASLGFVRYEDQHFGCASQEFLNWFAASPQDYIDAVMKQAVQRPTCIALLNLQTSFRELSLDKLIASVTLDPETLEGGCQTELHPIVKHIDRKYEWNEWEHRRKALTLVNLRQKRTHGSQTILSHFRRENATQVWLPKGVASQTHVNKGQSMPRKLRHIAGLRGAPGTQMTVLNLELDLGQPYQQ